ncbi:hypothetical protein [Veillonella magna]|uniref:hypothetical protein n=2 Tax=Veillonella magna TaxID=464322 RepID=UPI0023F579C8|nr:hypothetical protein [Veillonella magna]
MCIAAIPTYTMAETIHRVHVTIEPAGGSIPSGVMKRMQAGIQAAAEHIYVGKDSHAITSQSESYRQITADIVDRILYGYNVRQLTVAPGSTTELHLSLAPYGNTVTSVTTTVEYGTLSSEARQLVKRDMDGIDARAEQLLLGLPLDSLDWASTVAQQTIRDELAGRLPEFAVQTVVHPGVETQVTIYVIPQGAAVRKGHAEVVSNTLPAAVFWSTKREFDQYAEAMVGMPVAFVARHVPDINEEMQMKLNRSRAVTQFGISMAPKVQAGEDVTVLITADSSRYIARGEAYLDAGRSEKNVGLRLYAGVRQGKGSWYMEADFYPEDYSWNIFPSYKYAITEDTALTYQYNISDSAGRLRLDQALGGRWNARLQHDFKPNRNELGVSYDVHSYLTLEYVWAEHDNWLRVIGRI